MNINDMDFVYIIKPGEKGTELRYSLRSIAKHYPNHKVWIVGYKPDWIINVNYLPVEQCQTKWKNSTHNVIEACKCNEISDNFILMNDDFFAINPTIPLEELIDSNLDLLDTLVTRYKRKKEEWYISFEYAKELLEELKVEGPLYSYEAHIPLRINKKKFLEVMNLPAVQKFMQTTKVLQKRTIYKNIDKPKKSISLKDDTKVTLKKDDSKRCLNVCGWLSTADDLIGNSKFYNLNQILKNTLSQPCIYESDQKQTIPDIKPKQKHNYINF
ncbi:MAG: hypothetical protein J5691_00055 [Bacilli bacterium]|nr:hypothetical protein [Bacilli bacterium]